MKRDKGWLKEEVFELYPKYGKMYVSPDCETVAKTETISKVSELIEQLDEPQKPIVPQFVADYIEYHKVTGLTLGDWLDFVNEDEFERETQEWTYSGSYEENLKREYLLIDAIRYGYEVEKEKLYHVVNKENYFMLRKHGGLVDIMQVSSTMSRDEFGKDTRFMLTEQEIKDYDERYWAFAKEVTE